MEIVQPSLSSVLPHPAITWPKLTSIRDKGSREFGTCTLQPPSTAVIRGPRLTRRPPTRCSVDQFAIREQSRVTARQTIATCLTSSSPMLTRKAAYSLLTLTVVLAPVYKRLRILTAPWELSFANPVAN